MKIVLTMESHNGIFKSLTEGLISCLLLVDHSEFLAFILFWPIIWCMITGVSILENFEAILWPHSRNFRICVWWWLWNITVAARVSGIMEEWLTLSALTQKRPQSSQSPKWNPCGFGQLGISTEVSGKVAKLGHWSDSNCALWMRLLRFWQGKEISLLRECPSF